MRVCASWGAGIAGVEAGAGASSGGDAGGEGGMGGGCADNEGGGGRRPPDSCIRTVDAEVGVRRSVGVARPDGMCTIVCCCSPRGGVENAGVVGLLSRGGSGPLMAPRGKPGGEQAWEP